MGLWRAWVRDALMFTLGAIGFLHELWAAGIERPFILTACLALMGLPLVLPRQNGGK